MWCRWRAGYRVREIREPLGMITGRSVVCWQRAEGLRQAFALEGIWL
jgi:hypothetical protein